MREGARTFHGKEQTPTKKKKGQAEGAVKIPGGSRDAGGGGKEGVKFLGETLLTQGGLRSTILQRKGEGILRNQSED